MTLLIAAGSAILFIVAYHTYGRWLGRKIFNISTGRTTPAYEFSDGADFVPSDKRVVFGHHFTSIAGTGPIVGPAIAVFWGWLPALLWVVFGSILIGAVHDFASLVMSLRNQGRTIGDFCGDIINRRVRLLFLLIIMFALWIVIAIFGLVIATVFSRFPESVFPVWIQIPIAVALGWWVAKGRSITIGGIVAVLLMYATIWMTSRFPVLQLLVLNPGVEAPDTGQTFLALNSISSIGFWTILLLIYCYIASILPVQKLLQPRDFMNALQLVLAMGLLALGVIFAQPDMVAPAVRSGGAASGAPLVFPFLFITIACGACSGFHCLVSSGTSSKQLRSEGDAQFVGFGSMLLEGMLAVLVIIACVAGFGMGEGNLGVQVWNEHYMKWSEGLMAALGAFIPGSANMIEAVPLMNHSFAMAIMGVFVASFAATTLDTTCRLQRYVLSELGTSFNIMPLRNKHVATLVAVISGLMLAMYDVFGKGSVVEGLKTGGMGAMKLWPLFGATNQLLAGLALLVASVWLYRRRKPIWVTGIPMVFMLVMTGTGLVMQVKEFISPANESVAPNYLLFVVGLIILVLEAWMIFEALRMIFKMKRGEYPAIEEIAEPAG